MYDRVRKKKGHAQRIGKKKKGHAQRIAFVLQFGKFCELNRLFLDGDLP